MDTVKFNKALSFHNNNEFEKAILLYNLMLEEDPQNEMLNFYIGTAYLQKKNYSDAEKYLKIANSLNKKNFHTLSNLGILFKEINQQKKAIKFFNESISINPNFEHNYNNIANCYLEINLIDISIENYNKAISLNPLPDFLFNKAKALFKNKNYIDSLEILENLNIKNTLSIDGYRLFIKILKRLNNFNKIDDLFKKIIFKFNLDENLLIEYIDNLLAIDESRKALDFVKDIKDSYLKNFYKGLCFYKQGHYQDSLKIFNEIKNQKNDNNLLNNIGLIYKDLGDYLTAKNIFLNILKDEPDNPQANTNLGLIELFNLEHINGFCHYQKREVFFDPKYFSIIKKLPRFYKINKSNKKKIIVIPEQGIGDQILFYQALHFSPSNFDFVIDDRILKVLQNNFPSINFFKKNNIPDPENYVGFIMLADFFGEIINIFKPNFKDKVLKKVNSDSISNKYKFGISWKSFNRHIGSNKSLSISDIISIIPDTYRSNLVNLQYGDIKKDILEINKFKNTELYLPSIDFYNDLESLIDIILSCEFVLTTSNITAHLSGAFGKKTFLLCPYKSSRHWYWHNDKNCHYYPNTSIYYLDFSDLKCSPDYHSLIQDINYISREN